MTTALLFTAGLLALVAGVVAKTRAADARHRQRAASMDRALTDAAGHCWVCTAPAPVLELVDVGVRYELACLRCAPVCKARREVAA
jgi:hypothetical protein